MSHRRDSKEQRKQEIRDLQSILKEAVSLCNKILSTDPEVDLMPSKLWVDAHLRKAVSAFHKLRTQAELLCYKTFGLPIKVGEYGLEILTMDGVPQICSYEQLAPELWVLWDTTHGFSRAIDRMAVFNRGLDIVKPQVLCLELSCDNAQAAIDAYIRGELIRGEFFEIIFADHMSSGMDEYATLVVHAIQNNIKVKAVDIPLEEYHNGRAIPDNIPKYTRDYFEEEKKIYREFWTDYRENHMLRLMDSIKGQKLLIIGHSHRPTLIERLRVKSFSGKPSCL